MDLPSNLRAEPGSFVPNPELEQWLQKATIELYQRLSFFESQNNFGKVSITFNIQKGKIQNYEIDDKMVKRLHELTTTFDKK